MRIALPLIPLVLLAACSGGGGMGGGGSPTPTPNGAPSFTSGAGATVTENVTGIVYQATATDPNGDAVTFSISGGNDADKFVITSAGALGFKAPPDFDAPGDADGDNVYRLVLSASDGSNSTTRDVAITVTNSREGIAVRRVGTGFNQPLYVAGIPGDTRVYVVEKPGNVWRLDPATGAKTLVLTVDNLSTDGERGLLGLALRDASGVVYVHATAPDGAVEVRRYDLNAGIHAPATVLLNTPHGAHNNHNGGWIAFGPDGYLYDAIGDGGGAGDPDNHAQDPYSRLGKIVRLTFGGSPAPGNPFLAGGGNPYVFALGLRNPFRNSFAPDGRLIIGDVGQDAIEEIDVVRTNQPGLNFGWPWLEGTQPYRTGTPPAGLTPPVSQYMHGTGPRQGDTIIGGYVYRGPIASLTGQYVFGDYVRGHIWSVPASSLVQGSPVPARSYGLRNTDFAPSSGSIDQLVSFGEDAAGNLYLVDIDGDIFEAVPE